MDKQRFILPPIEEIARIAVKAYLENPPPWDPHPEKRLAKDKAMDNIVELKKKTSEADKAIDEIVSVYAKFFNAFLSKGFTREEAMDLLLHAVVLGGMDV